MTGTRAAAAAVGGPGRRASRASSTSCMAADYNPEQWPEEVWPEDVALMREAGVNLVSLGIFAWARLETAAGRYEFGWLDRVLDLLHDHGVAVDLATPTASPPPWLVRPHPEILPVTADGVTLWHGSRRHYCPHAPAYRERARASRARLAEHYRDHPALALWHVDNEYACHVGGVLLRRLGRRLPRLAPGTPRRRSTRLNEAWGTAFWSQTYGDWEEIDPPRRTPTFDQPEPAARLATLLLRLVARLLHATRRPSFGRSRRACRSLTNFMGFFKPVDYWALAPRRGRRRERHATPTPSDPSWMVEAAMIDDLMRSLGGGRPWMLMEQATGPRQLAAAERHETARASCGWAACQAVARGADAIMFFQWRASRAGAETVPQRDAPARRAARPDLARGDRARRGARAAR